MNATTKRLKKLETQHGKSFKQLVVCLDVLRARGIYNKFYQAWYKRASSSKGAHEELVYSYLYTPNGDIDKQAFIEEARDAIRNCNAYINVSKQFYLDSPLQVYIDLTTAATSLKAIFTDALSIISS